nr:hypothetical protein [Tanacetum cinerariifolium]
MDEPNITMKEYIRLEEEKAHRRGKVYNWETATYGKIWDNEDIHDLRSIETEFLAIVFNDTLTSEAPLSYEPMVSSLNNDEIDFRISFDESDDEDYTVIFDKNLFSYKIISVNDLKTDSKNDNDKVNMPLLPSPKPTVSYFNDLDYSYDFENEFPAIVYNDALTSKSNFSTEPTFCTQHIDEFDLKEETSLFKYDEEEQNVLNFNDLLSFNVIYPNDSKSDKDNNDDKVDIEHSSGDMSALLLSNHIDEFDLKEETSLFKYDEEEQNVLNFNDLLSFNVIYPNDSKSDKDNNDDKVDIEHSSGDMSALLLSNVRTGQPSISPPPYPMIQHHGLLPLLKERVKMLEDREGVDATRSRDDAPIKGRSMDEGEAATKRISDDSEEMVTVLTSMDAGTILGSGVVDVPTSSGSIPTASTPAEEKVPTGSDMVPTASLVFAIVVARELEEQLEREDQRKAEQIARDTEIARIHAEEELQSMINGLDRNNETIAKYLQKYYQFTLELPMERRIELITELVKYQDNYAKIYKYQSQQRKPMCMTFEEVEAKFNSVWKQMEDFIPMGLKEESERIKRKGLSLEQESAKDQKTSEEVPEEAMSSEEVPKEKRLVKETLNNRPPTSDKEMELWVELSREGLSSKEGSSTCDDQLQASSGELLTDGERFDLEDILDYKLSKTASVERCHCQKKSEATYRKIALLSKVKKKLSVKVK